MRKKILFYLLLFFPIFSLFPLQEIQEKDIRRVTERFFSFHIENKTLTPTVLKRWFKIYIEQFDSEKSYLLAKEVLPYLQMNDETIDAVIAKINKEDYSAFHSLNRLIQKAIIRAQAIRTDFSQKLNLEKLGSTEVPRAPWNHYASDESELYERQKVRMARFYQFQSQKEMISSEQSAKLFSLFDRKLKRLEKLYFSDKGNEHLFSIRVLKAFAKSLDTHTSFFSFEEANEMRLNLEKQFEGVGVILSEGIDGVLVADIVKNSPAEQSKKIQINDLLVEIDGASVEAMPLEEVLSLLKNRDKKELVLGFKHNRDSSVFRVNLQKQPIVMNEARIRTSTEKYGDGVLGKISLYSFYESSDGMSSEKDIKEAIRSFQKMGPLNGLILDLRENSGGFLRQAIKVAGLFLSNGVVAISKYGKGEIHLLRNIVENRFYNGPLIVLISKMSASASEIVAQALQDYGVAVIAGDERSFGKGSIQYQTVTDEKSDLFFKVTVGKYYTPSGNTTQVEGVKSDILIPTNYAPYRIGERYLEYPLSRDRVPPAFSDSLNDLDPQTKQLFQRKYLPTLQRVVSFWKKALPELRKRSEQRISNSLEFQQFLKNQVDIRSRAAQIPPNSIDEMPYSERDLQMIEATHILKDMINLQSQKSVAETMGKTGTE